MSEEELREMVSSHGDLSDDERRVLADVFVAADRRIIEIMVPRTEVAFLSRETPLQQAAEAIADQPHSRYPVTGNDTDDIVGSVHVRDLLTAARQPSPGNTSTVAAVMREILVVPGTNTLLPTLSQMRRERAHMALVIDEYGGTNGVVTMEDLLEELVGDIEDEYDPATVPGAPASDTAELDGLLHRDDVQELTGLNLPEGPYETLAGFLMTKLGHVPGLGDELDALGYHFQVTEMDGRRPSRIRVEAQQPEDSPPTPDGPQSADTVL